MKMSFNYCMRLLSMFAISSTFGFFLAQHSREMLKFLFSFSEINNVLLNYPIDFFIKRLPFYEKNNSILIQELMSNKKINSLRRMKRFHPELFTYERISFYVLSRHIVNFITGALDFNLPYLFSSDDFQEVTQLLTEDFSRKEEDLLYVKTLLAGDKHCYIELYESKYGDFPLIKLDDNVTANCREMLVQCNERDNFLDFLTMNKDKFKEENVRRYIETLL